MADREEFLRLIWDEVINASVPDDWRPFASDEEADEAFGDVGPAVKRLLDLGASNRDISLIVRMSVYEAVFNTLVMFGDPGLDELDEDCADTIESLHEELLSADPSGTEAAPGSWPS